MRPALNENQPRVEQQMLWAGFLKVKPRKLIPQSFWNQAPQVLPCLLVIIPVRNIYPNVNEDAKRWGLAAKKQY